MKPSTILLAGGIVLALFYVTNLGVAGNVLQYYIQSVDFSNITTARIVLMVQNPSNANIVLNSMAGTISVNGSTMGNISNFQGGVTIPANTQQPVTIFVALSLSAIASNLYDVLMTPNGANRLSFVIAGNANINGGVIVPFNIIQDLNV